MMACMNTSTILEPLTSASSESKEVIAYGPKISNHISQISQPTIQTPTQFTTMQTRSSETDMIGKESHEISTKMILSPSKPISGSISTHTLSPRPSGNFLVGEATKIHISPANSGSKFPDCCIDSSGGANEVQESSYMNFGNKKSGRSSNFGVFRSFRITTPSPKAQANSNITKPTMIGSPSVSGASLATSSLTVADKFPTNSPTLLVEKSSTGNETVAMSPVVNPDVPDSSLSPAIDTTITVSQFPNLNTAEEENASSANDTIIIIGSSSNSETQSSSSSPAIDTTIIVSQSPNTDVASVETAPSANDMIITIGSSSNTEALNSSLSPASDTTIRVSQIPNIDVSRGESAASASDTVITIGSSSNSEGLSSGSSPAIDTTITVSQSPNTDVASVETAASANDMIITIGSSSNTEALNSSLSPATDTTITVSQLPNSDTDITKGESSLSANNTVIMIGSSSNFETPKSSSFPATDIEIKQGQLPNIDKAIEGSSSTPNTKDMTSWHRDVDESIKSFTNKSLLDTVLEQSPEITQSPTIILATVGDNGLNYVPQKIVPTNAIVGTGKKTLRRGYRMTRRALMRKQVLTLLVGRELAGPAKELIKRSIDTNNIV
ncbi:BgtAc-30463 [Blumeria graminis f. sp. tritici]|uniref:BgtAc-30463 n=2 Tax=Blumeria graminis f. sp. tritici TaxID=62690 RepID=A0A9X9QEG6_BLUGR|nr:hypothetical protein BGT96224_Ac30463 [Blumeria graminis f. sp. tritici 96224]VDB90729.1 BgtAc-30463 [Blumeria graminis f. sp. tritici]